MTDSSSVGAWILLVSLLLQSVYCQQRISVSPGSDVLMQCSYTDSSKLNVFWRYEDTYKLVDIIDGRMDLSGQDSRFRDRIRTFSEFYTKGNFSVVLENVSLNDAGPYNCHIPSVDFQQQLQLTVTAVKPTDGTLSGSVSDHSYCSLLSIMLSVALLVSL